MLKQRSKTKSTPEYNVKANIQNKEADVKAKIQDKEVHLSAIARQRSKTRKHI
jgi:hypothetical protein